MKKCSRCGETKPLGAFYVRRRKGRKDRLYSQCKVCHGEVTAAWRAKNGERVKTNRAKWNAANRQAYRLMWYYKMTVEDWDKRLADQGGVCAGPGCGAVPTDVDHNHDCCPTMPTCGNCVRGLLCRSCNARDVLAKPSS